MRKVEVETVDAVRRRVEVEVPQEEVTAELTRAYETLKRTVRVPGFRPGKAPRSLLERLYGEQVRADVVDKLVQESFVEALEKQTFQPVGPPQIVTEETGESGPIRYSALVEVKPDVVASDYVGIEVERPVYKVEDADVDQVIEGFRESQAQLRPLSDRSRAERGDFATVDFKARLDGEVLQHGEDRTVPVEDADGEESFGSHLDGGEIGETVRFDFAFPENHPDSRVAGRTVDFEVTLKKLLIKEIPPLDDEFAKDHGACDTLEELRAQVRKNLEEMASRRTEEAVRARILEELARRHELDVPEAMVDRRTDSLVEQTLNEMGPNRPPESQEAEVQETLRKELREQAREHVKVWLVLEAVARQEGIEVAEEDVDAYVTDLVPPERPELQEQVRQLYEDPERRAAIRERLLQQKALDFVIGKARFRDVEPEKEESC